MPKRKISAEQLVADLNAGLSDEELMAKYELSGQELQRIFHQLRAKGLIGDDLPAVPPTPAQEDVVLDLSELSSQETTNSDETDDITLQNLFGEWYENRKTLILLLIFASPIGLYGLYKTSIFTKKAKTGIGILTVVLALTMIKAAWLVWLLAVTGIGAYVLCQLLPFGRRARIALSVVAWLLVVGTVAQFIDADSEKTKSVPAQPTVETQPALQPVQAKTTHVVPPAPEAKGAVRLDAKTAKDCAKRCSDKAMSKDDPVSAYERCITECPESVQRNHKCVMACSDKCGRMTDLHRSPAEDWDAFQARVKKAGKEIPECLNKCAADCNRQSYGE